MDDGAPLPLRLSPTLYTSLALALSLSRLIPFFFHSANSTTRPLFFFGSHPNVTPFAAEGGKIFFWVQKLPFLTHRNIGLFCDFTKPSDFTKPILTP